jgi:uncharacterized protein YbgA (DUF1722 family)
MTEYHDTKWNLTKSDKKWHQQYEKLVEFKRKNGHCIVRQTYWYEQDKALANWVNQQRKLHASNKMRPDRKDLLDKIEFVWRVGTAGNHDKNWQQQYEKLVEFKRKNGHCLVPLRHEQNKALGQWVGKQRKLHTKNEMPLDLKQTLDNVGFVWRVETAKNNEKNWHQQYEKLVQFKRKNGHCIVPRRYEQDNSLGRWVSRQRTYHNQNNIRLDRKELLVALEFVWEAEIAGSNHWRKDPSTGTHEVRWCQYYAKLVEFKRKNGHCIVPQRYNDDASFGGWVSKQRKLHTNQKIRLDRKELLDTLEFVWKVDAHVARRSTTTDDVSSLAFGSFHAFGPAPFSHSLLLVMLDL